MLGCFSDNLMSPYKASILVPGLSAIQENQTITVTSRSYCQEPMAQKIFVCIVDWEDRTWSQTFSLSTFDPTPPEINERWLPMQGCYLQIWKLCFLSKIIYKSKNYEFSKMYVIVYFVHDDLRFLSWFVKFLCSIYTSYTISVLEFSFSKIRIVVEIIFTGTS